MKKSFLYFMVFFLSLAFLYAGGKKETKDASQPKAEGKVTVQYMGPWTVEPVESVIQNGLIEKFSKDNPKVAIEQIGVPSADLIKKVQAMAAAGNLPDLVLTNGANVPIWKDMGILQNVGKMLDKTYISGFYPQMLAEFSVDGEIYGIPAVAAPFVLIIRKDLFDAAKLPIPKSFDDLLAAAKALTVDANKDGKIDRYGFAMMGFPDGNTAYRFILTLFAAGAPDVYKDANGKWATKVASPEGIEAYKFYYDLAIANKCVPPGVTEVDYKNLVNLLATDQAAMAISGPHTIGTVYQQNPSLKGKFIAVPFIGKKPVALLNSWGLVMTSSSKAKDQARDFMRYMADTNNFIEMFKVTKRLPSRTDAPDTIKKEVPEIVEILGCPDFAIPLAQVPFRGEVLNAVGKNVNAMLAGTLKSPEDASKEGGKAIQDILNKNN